MSVPTGSSRQRPRRRQARSPLREELHRHPSSPALSYSNRAAITTESAGAVEQELYWRRLRGFGPLPTTRLTLAPLTRVVPAGGLARRTRPFFFFGEKRRVILPTRQCAFLIAARAFASGLPTTFGTTQDGGGGVVVTVQEREAGVASTLLAASVAFTAKLCGPSAGLE